MTKEQAEKEIRAKIRVTRQMLTVAKIFFLKHVTRNMSTEGLVTQFLESKDASWPAEVCIRNQAEEERVVQEVANSLSWQHAACEAVWELVHSNRLIFDGKVEKGSNRTEWDVGGASRLNKSEGKMNFDDLAIPVPSHVRPAPSATSAAQQVLSDGDLYLNELQIDNMHPDLAKALSEAVLCFRQELFNAAVAMLGKASEGAWLELGASLVSAVSEEKRGSIQQQVDCLENPNLGIAKKIQEVIAVYDRKDLFKQIVKSTGIRGQFLRQAAVWSDVVRDSRNTIHFGVASALPNTYEKVATLLLASAPYLRTLYALKKHADDAAKNMPTA